jgi:hypothetical protein
MSPWQFFATTAALSAVVVLLWGWLLPGFWRRGFALVSSAAGIAFLIVGQNTQGESHASTTVQYLMGSLDVTEYASASASLPYYVLTAACLLLGTLGLALSDDVAHRIGEHAIAIAVAVSLFMTLLRFALEKAAAPDAWTQAVGITWLAPLVGAYFASRLDAGTRNMRRLATSMLVYGVITRAGVVAMMLAATLLRAGSHYDVSSLLRVRSPFSGRIFSYASGSLSQMLDLVVLPQLTFWVLYTLLAGLLGGILMLASGPTGATQIARRRTPDLGTSAS